MYILREGCTHMNPQTTFKERSTKNFPNSRCDRTYIASEPHPMNYNDKNREADSFLSRPSITTLKPESCKLGENAQQMLISSS